MEQGMYAARNRRKKRNRQIIATVAFIITVASIAAVICLAMFFNIEEIRVSGLTTYSREEIVAASQIAIGQNIFAISRKEVVSRLYDQFPYVDSVKMVRLLPTTVEIIITETTGRLAIVDSAGHYSLLGENDRILRHVDDVSTEGLPIILGVDLSMFAEGAVIDQKTQDDLNKRVANLTNADREEEAAAARRELEYLHTAVGKLQAAGSMLEAAEELGLSEDISYYDVSDDLSVSLLYDNRALVELGAELELDYKIKFAKRVLEELQDNFVGTVDLSTAGNNGRAYTLEQDISPLMNKVYYDGYY